MSNFTIGQLAKAASVGVETIRFYERKGLVKKPSKNGSGFRQYQVDDVTRIRFIKKAQELGGTLREIKDLLELDARRKTTCSDYGVRIKRKLDEVDEKIESLQRLKKALGGILASCEDNPKGAECRMLECFENGWKMPKTCGRKAVRK